MGYYFLDILYDTECLSSFVILLNVFSIKKKKYIYNGTGHNSFFNIA